MKRFIIRRLRKKLASYKTFEVKNKDSKCGGRMIKASNFEHAMKRYFLWYWRHFKEKHPSCYKEMYETTSKFGNIVVIDQKGYKKYYI